MEEYTVIVNNKGDIFWYQNAKIHRLDGPAVIRKDGTKLWYKEGKFHRIDGPAVEYVDGYKTWYIDGKEYNQDEFDEITKIETKELTLEEVSSLLGYKIKIVG